MANKKIIGLVTLSLAGVMALSSFALASDKNINSGYTKTTAQTEQQTPNKPERGENIFKTKRGLINKDIIKSILNLDDEQLKTKLEEHENNAYKLLESHGKVEEYKSVYLKTIKEKLDKAVADGKITKEKSDIIYAKAQEAINGFNAESGGLGITPKGDERPSFSFSSDDLPEGTGKAIEVFADFRNEMNSRDGIDFSLGLDGSMLASILNISAEELRTKLAENNGNLYKVLEEMGKVEEYKNAALKITKDALDKAVADGRIAQKYADSIYARAEEVIDNFNGNEYSMFTLPDSADTFRKYQDKRKNPTETETQSVTPEPTTESTTPAPTTEPEQSTQEENQI